MIINRHRPIILLMLFTVLAFGLMYFVPSDFKSTHDMNVLIYGAVLCFLNLITYCVIRKFGLGDTYLYLIASMLSAIGLIIILRLDYSGYGEYVSVLSDGTLVPSANGYNQLIFIVIGHVIFFASYFLYKFISL